MKIFLTNKDKKIVFTLIKILIILTLLVAIARCKKDSILNLNSPTVANTSPADPAFDISTDTNIMVTFNREMEPSTITTNIISNECLGTIQLSKDDFNSCIQMFDDPSATTENSTFTLTPKLKLDQASPYRIKVTTGVRDISGISLESDFITEHGFITEGCLASGDGVLNDLNVGTPFRKGPYLIYPGDNTKMNVLWQTETSVNTIIEWGSHFNCMIGREIPTESGIESDEHQYVFSISNLNPGTKYYYRIIENQTQHSGSFLAAPTENELETNIFIYGDTRTGPTNHETVAQQIVNTFKADPGYQTILLHTGDWTSQSTESDWDAEFFPSNKASTREMQASLPVQGVRGNHEVYGEIYEKYWPYPYQPGGFYWSFDYGPGHFVVVDQYASDFDTDQLDWIEDDLKSTTKPWKFIYYHKPGWSAGGHSNNTDVQNDIQPILEKYNVSVAFAGHNHYYSRLSVNGVQHITTGGGGAPIRSPDLDTPNLIVAEKAYHFCKMKIDGDLLSFSAVNTDGTIIDSFTISKSD